jgi:hypothetical protein
MEPQDFFAAATVLGICWPSNVSVNCELSDGMASEARSPESLRAM